MSLTYLNENSVECIDDTVASGNFAKLIAKYGICGEGDTILDVCSDLKIIFIVAVIQVSLVAVQPVIAAISLLISKIRCRKNRSVEPINDYVGEDTEKNDETEYKEESKVKAIQLEKVEESKSIAEELENEDSEDSDSESESESEDETDIESSDSSDDDCGCFPKRKKHKNDEVEAEPETDKEVTEVEVFETKEEPKDVESVYSVLNVEKEEDIKVLAVSSSSLGLLILMSFITGIIEIIIYRKLFTKLNPAFLL